MKCVSLWQPWASGIAVGAKTFETRSWATKYRGPLLIHAAARWTRETAAILAQAHWQAALYPIRYSPSARLTTIATAALLPFGALVAVCDLIECIPTGRMALGELYTPRWWGDSMGGVGFWREADMGNFTQGRWAWRLASVRQLVNPIPYRGRQGLFNVPDEHLPAELRAA